LLLEGGEVRWRGRSLCGGEAFGPLVGGNLCTFASLAGTPHALRAPGAVLLLEEVGERPYRVDRLLNQLLRSGALEGVRAVVLGGFVGCAEPGEPGWSAEQVAAEGLAELGVPVLAGLPVGHGAENHAFPWGVDARLVGSELIW
jgi:muramoyltetrapeptide carboxypeptidase